jgi:hypothetical protein
MQDDHFSDYCNIYMLSPVFVTALITPYEKVIWLVAFFVAFIACSKPGDDPVVPTPPII